jgi:hypothetical protein
VRSASGQGLVLAVISLVVLLGMAGMVIDIGSAFYASRSLQASTDAAALAGAQQLPDSASAVAVAKTYSGMRGQKNEVASLPDVQAAITTKCLQSRPGCNPVNAVVVDEAMDHKTSFLGVLGIGTIHLHAKACESKPLDIMLVLDRTGSMCQDHWGNNDPSCTDLNNARIGMETFLSYFDSKSQWIGFSVFPPATSVGSRCTTPQTSNYDSQSAAYVVVPLSSDYKTGANLNKNSDLVKTIECQKGGGRTSYATALEKAQTALDAQGRPNVKDIVVFFSDGAANIGPTFYSPKSPYRMQPCHQGVWSSNPIKSKGTDVYTIGYDLNAENGGANKCTSWDGKDEIPTITAYTAIQQIAGPGNFYNQPTPGDLQSIFDRIAADIAKGSSRLVDNDTP